MYLVHIVELLRARKVYALLSKTLEFLIIKKPLPAIKKKQYYSTHKH